jgi:hypothetical protein
MKPTFTIQHYLDQRVKAKVYAGVDFYPLGIKVGWNGKEASIKSRLGEYLKIYTGHVERLANGDQKLAHLFHAGLLSERWLTLIQKEKKFPLFHLMKDETDSLKKVVELRISRKGKISLSDIDHMYESCVKEITDVIDDHIKFSFLEELKTLFLKSIDAQEKKEIFKIVNYFIHFLNWNHPFYTLYDATSDIMPGELRKVEGQLSKDLRLSIKAYTAFYTYINPLKRFFEKREQGRIATLSFLDWQSDIKELLVRQFTSIMGKKTAVLYVTRLDEILNHCLACEE